MVNKYRTDIDGLRAIAVFSVILFHLKHIKNGYLGVDVFFVISGYLITSIIFKEVENNTFSILKFYERRIRRIIPLVLFTTFIAFILGLIFMLPDDLENLSQSVIASNFSGNNMLMYITSSNYWAVKNDYKPLMHTWSLGVEEQFYLFYPFIFFFFKKKKRKQIIKILIGLSLFSLIAFLVSNDVSAKFYFIQYRFFELAIGGIAAIYFKEKIYKANTKNKSVLFILLVSLLGILFLPLNFGNTIQILLVTLITSGILVLGSYQFEDNRIYNRLLSNKIITSIGKISFSIYMWHQIVFSFVRYVKIEVFTVTPSILLILVILALSIGSYLFIENPFRDKKRWKTKQVLIILSLFFVLITSSSFYVYLIGGVVRDVPQLGLKYELIPKKFNFFNRFDNVQRRYNDRIRSLDKSFTKTPEIKVLVIGNSFGRDFTNLLLESSFKDKIEIRYMRFQKLNNYNADKNQLVKANYIFIAKDRFISKKNLKKIEKNYQVDFLSKVTIVGTKDFGYSNGIHYNKIRNKKRTVSNYRTKLKEGVISLNDESKLEWNTNYIDLIKLTADKDRKVLVFTPKMKFISQDTRHFTKYGAVFYAELLDKKLIRLLKL